MIVVSDTSPLIVLAKLGRLDLLRRLFGIVAVPPEVWLEATKQAEKAGMADIADGTASWLRILTPRAVVAFKGLHEGETAAIALAKELGCDFLLVDERNGRRAAAKEGVKIMGTVGVLEKAAEAGLIDSPSAFEELLRTNFYVTAEFLEIRLQLFRVRSQPKAD